MLKNGNKAQDYVNILGFKVCSSPKQQLLAALTQKLSHNSSNAKIGTKLTLFSANPELLLMASKNVLLNEALDNASYLVPDGVGVKYAARFLERISLEVIPGRELFLDLIKIASENNLKVYLLGGEGQEAEKTADILRKKYKNLSLAYQKGPKINSQGDIVTEVYSKSHIDIVTEINKFKPDLLFVAFGNPKQELFIHNNINKLNAPLIMAVGGTFRYVSGMSKLPPQWLSSVGMEWFWRLITEPQRYGRIFNAVIIFPLKVLQNKLG